MLTESIRALRSSAAVSPVNQYRPGSILTFIDAFEGSGLVDSAVRACWGSLTGTGSHCADGSLGGLLTPKPSHNPLRNSAHARVGLQLPRAVWWTQFALAQIADGVRIRASGQTLTFPSIAHSITVAAQAAIAPVTVSLQSPDSEEQWQTVSHVLIGYAGDDRSATPMPVSIDLRMHGLAAVVQPTVQRTRFRIWLLPDDTIPLNDAPPLQRIIEPSIAIRASSSLVLPLGVPLHAGDALWITIECMYLS